MQAFSANRKQICQIKVGDLIYPPKREISLWMKKALAEKGLGQAALILTVIELRDSKADKNGAWTFVKAQYSKEWTLDYAQPERPYYMTFLVRPHTLWEVP